MHEPDSDTQIIWFSQRFDFVVSALLPTACVCVCVCVRVYVCVLLAYIRADEFKMFCVCACVRVCVCVCVRSRHKDKLAVSNCCTVMNADPPLHRAVSASLDSPFQSVLADSCTDRCVCHYVRRIRSVSLTPG